MTKLQEYAAQLKEAVEKTPDKEQIFAAERWLAQVGYSDSRVHSSGAIARLLAGYASEYVRNLVPPLLEEIGKQGWISVEDGLPEPGVQVIVAHKNGGSFVATAMVHSKQRGEWVHCHDPNWPFAGRVTLWQPLPKPPEITSSGEKK